MIRNHTLLLLANLSENIFYKRSAITFIRLCLFVSPILFSGCSRTQFTQKSGKTSNNETLLARVTTLEDRLEILTLLSGSAFSSDIASESYWTKMFIEDAVLDRGASVPQDRGREQIIKVVNGPDQREAIKAGMTHLAMMPHIKLNGDSAVTTGYLLIVMPDAEASHVKLPGKGVSPGFSIYQLTVNRWELVRTADGWKVAHRTVRPIMSTDSRDLLVRAIEDMK